MSIRGCTSAQIKTLRPHFSIFSITVVRICLRKQQLKFFTAMLSTPSIEPVNIWFDPAATCSRRDFSVMTLSPGILINDQTISQVQIKYDDIRTLASESNDCSYYKQGRVHNLHLVQNIQTLNCLRSVSKINMLSIFFSTFQLE